MFQQRCNELRLTLRLAVKTPLLIDAGDSPAALMSPLGAANLSFPQIYAAEQAGIATRIERAQTERKARKQALIDAEGNTRKLTDKADLDLRFVRTKRNGGDEPYLPGASLKGVLRSHSEQLLRTFLPAGMLCDPFDQEHSCTKAVEALLADERYRRACPACRLFGCGGLASRLHLTDGYLAPHSTVHWGERSGVGINRARGAAESGALFFYEVLEGGAFRLEITLDNFELWQLGLLAHTLHDLWQGQLPVGYGAQRGLGLLTGEVTSATLTYFGLEPYAADDGCLLHGVDTLYTPLMPAAPPLFVVAPPAVALPAATGTSLGLRHTWTLPRPAQDALWAAGAAAFATWLSAPEIPSSVVHPNTSTTEESTP